MLFGVTALVSVLGVCLVALASVDRPRSRIRRPDRPVSASRVRRMRARELDMGMILTEVASRLRSGAMIEHAWQETLADYGLHQPEGSPVLDGEGVPVALRRLWNVGRLRRWKAGMSGLAADAIPPMIAVCRMGHSTGAPMADILDACALGVTESTEAQSARDVAIAGPQSSATMLAILPLVGIALGSIIGADPFAFLFGSVWGHISLIAGIGCEIAGIVLVIKMISRAKREVDVL